MRGVISGSGAARGELGGVECLSARTVREAPQAKVVGTQRNHRGALRVGWGKFLPLPATPLEACQKRPTRASSQALVRYATNDYSVPTAYGHRAVLVKAFVWEVVISAGSEVIARHAEVTGERK